MQAFSLDPSSGIPVKLQLKAHMKYQILAGLIRPGDQLPPLRDLAAGLGIHLNTVVRAVDELSEDGYLYSHQGKGVFVADEFPGQGHGAALRSLLAGVMQPAREWGIPPDELALALMAHGQLAKPPQAVIHRLLLVGGSRPVLRRLQGELEGALPLVVETALIDEVPDRLRQSDYRVIASTLFHAGEVARLSPSGTTLATLANPAAVAAYQHVKDLPAGATVVVASRDWLHAARVRRSLEQGGLKHLQLKVAVGETPGSLAPDLAGADRVLVTPDCRELVREALGGAMPFLAEPVEVPAEAASLIRRALGIPAAEPKVHVRSAWV